MPDRSRTRTALTRLRVSIGVVVGGVFAAASVEWWSALSYLAGLHGSLGRGVWPVACALFAVVALFLVPLAVWLVGPALALPGRALRALVGLALAIALLLSTAAASYVGAQARPAVGEPIPETELALLLDRLGRVLARRPPPAGARRSLLTEHAVECNVSPAVDTATLIATAVVRRPRVAVESVCLQAPTVERAFELLEQWAEERSSRGPVKLDVVASTAVVSRRHAWLDALKFRPGLDGACYAQRCLMPWQLLSQGFFSTYRPVSFVPDFQFGVSPEQLGKALGHSDNGLSGLIRLSTRSYVIEPAHERQASVTALSRMRRRDVSLSPQTLGLAAARFERHLIAAQQKSGKFRYTLDPFTGQEDTQGFNLARQAGAVLALCELGQQNAAVRRSIDLGLSVFSEFQHRHGAFRPLIRDQGAGRARLGESALPLVSLLTCGERVGYRFDELTSHLARFVLKLQRDDGSFAPLFELSQQKVGGDGQPLYASGQAVLALLLLEQRQTTNPSRVLPPLAMVRAAATRAMDYFADRYWTHPLRDFFFLEENWHCLAARAGLSGHRHVGYEAFCLDYVRFKARLILDANDGVDPDFDGGFGFGNVVPPHNTGAAGFGEALAAAVSVKRARGESTGDDEALLARVVEFVMRQQWTEATCFACASSAVVGGMSEHTHSAITRIDFAQHAWAALGHGALALGLD